MTDINPPAGYLPPAAGASVLLGLSGGADSVCLLDLLVRSGCRVSAAHVNHGIRGAEADRDEAFCRALAEKYGISIRVLNADIPALARDSGEGLEEAARRVRYAFFDEIMSGCGIGLLATAHNADDNLETVIFNLTRGGGARAACGIPPERDMPHGKLIRPLLGVTKRDITGYCRERGLEFVTDSTNADTAYSRNRIRMKIAPELRAINPSAAAAFARFSSLLRGDCDYLDSLALDFTGKNDLAADSLNALPPPVLRRVLLFSARDAGGRPEEAHIDALASACAGHGGAVSLPGGITARVRDGILRYEKDNRAKKPADIYPADFLIYPAAGENTLPGNGGRIILDFSGADIARIYNLSTFAALDIDKIKGKLFIRPRRPGDRILHGGMHRSLHKLLGGAHLPLGTEHKRRLPVICDSDGIVWVPYLPPRDGMSSPGAETVSVGYIPGDIKQ